jgi:hypothetical protein
MQKVITTVLALAAISGMAYYVMYGPTRDTVHAAEGTSAPKQQLDNVRQKAKEFEHKQDEHLNNIEQRMNNEAGPSGVADP